MYLHKTPTELRFGFLFYTSSSVLDHNRAHPSNVFTFPREEDIKRYSRFSNSVLKDFDSIEVIEFAW